MWKTVVKQLAGKYRPLSTCSLITYIVYKCRVHTLNKTKQRYTTKIDNIVKLRTQAHTTSAHHPHSTHITHTSYPHSTHITTHHTLTNRHATHRNTRSSSCSLQAGKINQRYFAYIQANLSATNRSRHHNCGVGSKPTFYRRSIELQTPDHDDG